jgi:class 3 adenylate cyclase
VADPELSIAPVVEWLDAGAPGGREPQHVLDQTCRRLPGAELGVKRGDAEDIRAVIWFCDLREATTLAEGWSPGKCSERSPCP